MGSLTQYAIRAITLWTAVAALTACESKSGSTSANQSLNLSIFSHWKSQDATGEILDLTGLSFGAVKPLKIYNSSKELICTCDTLLTGTESAGHASASSCAPAPAHAQYPCNQFVDIYTYSITNRRLNVCGLSDGICTNYVETLISSPPPGGGCVYDPTYGAYTIAGTTTPCVPGQAMTTTCPAAPNNFYTNHLGQVQTCTPGQQIPNTGGYNYGGQYPYPNYMNQTGCDQWTYQYGIQYVPVILQGQIQCVRLDVLASQAQGTSYGSNYDYYYAFPPYSDNSCPTMIDFGGSWGNLGICF